MTDSQWNAAPGADAPAAPPDGPVRPPRGPMPPWAWALVGAAAAVLVIGVVAAALLLPAYAGRAPAKVAGTTSAVLPTGTVESTEVTEDVGPAEIAETPPATGSSSSGSSGSSSSGKSSGSSGSSGSGGGGSTGSSGGGSTSTDSTVKIPTLVKPKIPLLALNWVKAYPADSNDWFYGTNQQWGQPFELPAGKFRVAFIIDTGGAAEARVGLVSLANQPTQSWKVPGLTLHHTFYFEGTTTAPGKWLAVAEPLNGAFTWRLRVERWGTP